MIFPMNTYKGEGTSWRKLNVITSLIWFLFFNSNFPFAYVATFSGQLYFGRSYLFILFESNYFDTTVTFWGQVFLQNSCYFLLFRNIHFFAGVIFSEQLLFRSENSTEQPLLENRKFFTAVTFRNSYFFSEELFRIKISKKELLFQSRYFFLHSINLFRKVTFWKKLIFQKINFRVTYFFWRAVFLEQLLFQKTLPSIAATFSEELLFYNILFQKSYYFTATVPFHSYTTYLFVSN